MRYLHDIWIVARYELAEAVRSRRAVVLLVLFIAGGMLMCNAVVSGIYKMETQLSETLGLPASASAGVVTDALWKHKEFRRMITHFFDDESVAEELLSVPPMAMVFSWLAFIFTPVLVVLVTSGRISEEIGSGSVRFALLRTPRSAWCLGKYFGQSFMLIVALMLGAIGAWCIFRFRLTGIDNLAMARAMIIYAWKVWLYSLSFVGLSLGISQVTCSPVKAMAAAFIAWIALSVLSVMARHYIGDGINELWQLVLLLTPQGHRTDMWRLDMAHQVQAAFYLVTLGFVYLFAGFAFFSRNDI